MEDVVKISVHKRFLISKNNIILRVNRDFLDLVGYAESELIGKTLVEAGKIFRLNSQVELQDMEGDTSIFIFTKELVAIEGRISCEIMDNGAQKVFSFKIDTSNIARQSFNLANQLGTSRGSGVAIFSLSNLVLINSNQTNLDFLEPPYNKKINSIGKSIMEILPERAYDLLDKIKSHFINTGNPFYGEEIELKGGSSGETYWNVSLVPISENEKIKYLILYLSNETEKVLNRESLKQRNKELETIIGNISDEILIFDKDFNVDLSSNNIKGNLTFNDPSLRPFNNMYDFKHNTLIFDEDNQLIAYENLPFKKVFRGEIVSDFLIKTVNNLGIIYRAVNGYPKYDRNGKFSRGILIFKDIEDRIKKEEARLIKTQKELLSKVVEALNLELIRCTYPEFKIISINSNSYNTFLKINNGTEDIDCPIGKSYFNIVHMGEEDKREELISYFLKKGNYSYIHYTNHIVDGEKRFFKTINQPIFGLDNKIIEIIFITMDITDEVKEKNKMEETLEMQNQMFTTISHELKTPLSVIFSAGQLIEMDLKEEINNINKEEINNSVTIIKQNCYRFIKLINNIIDLSRMESGFYKLHCDNKNIVEVVEDIVDSLRDYVEAIGLHIIFDTEIEEKIMAVDVDKMERIILNLISNALKFSPKGESIYIEIKDKGDFVLILVRDCGVGIDKKHLNTIFDRYKKVDNSLFRNAEGSGIGLSLVKTMINLIGGRISVESELGKGSVFTIKLPVKILDESEVTSTIEDSDNRIERLNIEFSDIYPK